MIAYRFTPRGTWAGGRRFTANCDTEALARAEALARRLPPPGLWSLHAIVTGGNWRLVGRKA